MWAEASASASRMSSAFFDFVRLVLDGNLEQVSRRLDEEPALATMSAEAGATRQGAAPFFFSTIAHYLYQGDTALHNARGSVTSFRRGARRSGQ